jgi:hypothetical protein
MAKIPVTLEAPPPTAPSEGAAVLSEPVPHSLPPNVGSISTTSTEARVIMLQQPFIPASVQNLNEEKEEEEDTTETNLQSEDTEYVT